MRSVVTGDALNRHFQDQMLRETALPVSQKFSYSHHGLLGSYFRWNNLSFGSPKLKSQDPLARNAVTIDLWRLELPASRSL